MSMGYVLIQPSALSSMRYSVMLAVLSVGNI